MYSPAEVARRYVETGRSKAALPTGRMLLLGMLAGAFIALAGGSATFAVSYGGRLAGAAVFPAGLAMGLPVIPTYIVSVIGNMLPVPVILLFAKAVLLWCTKLPGGLGRFFMKIYDKGVKAGEKMQAKAGRGIYWALFLFVAIPLPGTGAWTGCLAATLLDLKFWPSVLAVLCGVMTAGLIMGAASAGLLGALGMIFA